MRPRCSPIVLGILTAKANAEGHPHPQARSDIGSSEKSIVLDVVGLTAPHA